MRVSPVILLLLLAPTLFGQVPRRGNDTAREGLLPIARLLDPEGQLQLDSNFSGALDPAGYRMRLAADGSPRFLRADTISLDSLDSLYRDYPGDRFWDESFGPPGIDGPVYALAMLRGELYVGGRFTVTGNVLAYNISRWNGRSWAKLRDGIGGVVFALAVMGDTLYVGGAFESAGGARAPNIVCYIPREDRWEPLGFDVGTKGTIRAMLAVGRRLYVAGEFDTLLFRGDAMRANGIAAWNGVFWSTMGDGLGDGMGEPPRFAGGRALAIVGSDLFVGGSFIMAGGVKANGLARWDGTQWHPMPVLLDGYEDGTYRGEPRIRALVVVGDELIVGGSFRNAGDLEVRNIARWNLRSQRWEPLGGGLSDTVSALAHDGQYLYAAGSFTEASSRVVNYVARFDGSSWNSMQGGVFDTATTSVAAMISADSGLFIGGHFIVAGRVSAHHVARWDGEAWHPLAQQFDEGVNRNGTDGNVLALSSDGELLYAGGDFETAGGEPARRVAVWDGEEWRPLGGGIEGLGGFVRALAVHDGDLYVGGVFDRAGGRTAVGIARWDGAEWHDVGGGLGGASPYAFALHATDTALYVAGAFTQAGSVAAKRVARWSFASQSWAALGEGLGGDSTEYVFATALCHYGSDLIVGGNFARAGGARARRIARWNGTAWSAMAAGRDSGANAPVNCLVAHEGSLYAGGEFESIGATVTGHLARFDGSAWSRAFAGFEPTGPVRALASVDSLLVIGGSYTVRRTVFNDPPVNNIAIVVRGKDRDMLRGTNACVHAVCAVGGVLYAGGEFTMAGTKKADHVALWDDAGWAALGSDPTSGVYGLVRAVTVHGDDVYVGGAFTAVGGTRARNVARWDGKRWRPLGRGRSNGVNGAVFAIAWLDSSVFVGGAFTRAGDRDIGYLARWDGSTWSSLGSGIAGNNPYVFALLADVTGLFVGGAFNTVGGLSANKIGRFDVRTDRWSVLDSGVSGGSYYTYVSALCGTGEDLYVGGNFARAGVDVPANNIAHWDGSAWSALGSGVNRSVFAIAMYRNEIYACGDFTAADTARTRYIACWDGSRWRRVGDGFNLPAYDLAVYDGELFVAGRFQLAGTILAMGLARWDGERWDNLGKGIQHGYRVGTAYGLGANDSGLFAGGDFTVAGGKASYYFGRWHRPSGSTSSVVARSSPPRGSLQLSVTPHPISSGATVRFTSPAGGRALVMLVDPMGRHVALLLDRIVTPGETTLNLDCSDLASGCYIARATVGPLQSSTTIIVQR